MKHSGTADVAAGLAWASGEDRTFYQAKIDEYAARAAARLQPREPASTSTGSPPPAASKSSPAPSGPTFVSVSAHIDCDPKVRVFRGSSTGSGTYGWESDNSTVSWSIKAGDQICVCDASDERGSCWTASGSGRVDMVITCGGFTVR
jgi:hypothetical protein